MTVRPPRPVTTDPSWAELSTWWWSAFWFAFGAWPRRTPKEWN